MVLTEVDLIERVGGGSCRCMLVEDWSAMQPINLKQRLDKMEGFRIAHEQDDFFESELDTNEDESIDHSPQQENYWDRQFEDPLEGLADLLDELNFEKERDFGKLKAGKRYPVSSMRKTKSTQFTRHQAIPKEVFVEDNCPDGELHIQKTETEPILRKLVRRVSSIFDF